MLAGVQANNTEVAAEWDWKPSHMAIGNLICT